MLEAKEHARYIREYIAVYRAHANDPLERELACLQVQIPYALEDLTKDCFYAGAHRALAIGFAPQEAAGFAYFFNEGAFAELLGALDAGEAAELSALVESWRQEADCALRLRKSYSGELAEALPSDRFLQDHEVGYPLYRIGGVHIDFGKLVALGIPGLRAEVRARMAEAGETPFLKGLLRALELFEGAVKLYCDQARQVGNAEVEEVLRAILTRAPQTMREALQLVHLYAIVSGAMNYGRMDDYLGRFSGDADALECIVEFWKKIEQRGIHWDGRVVLGGRGRKNEAEADRFALLAMEASCRYRDTLPQLTMRFYDGQNPALLQKAYDNFAQGVVYPILYRDEINIPAVQKAFGLPEAEAEHYIPFGCGEYVIDHCSIGTPSGVINLLMALNQAIERQNCESFEELFAAYCAIVEKTAAALAVQEKLEYDFAAETAPFLMYSLLLDDCIARSRPFLSGGVRYLGGTLETYGNINTADSLTAIRRAVFEEKSISFSRLREALRNDFKGYERERRILRKCPKFGNDLDEADAMAIRVHEHICNFVRAQAKKVGLDSYLVVIINNNANSGMGACTGASADGRGAGEPMANANNPSGGADQCGVTAFLNSLVKLDCTLHAGAVQNMKFSRSLLTEHRQQFEMLMQAYFTRGQQAMLNILNRGDLEDAQRHPEKYPNLIVRVGGFSARFVELDAQTQKEIISRTLY